MTTTALLSRVAESIFWIGRYIERAEGTARILDVAVHHALEEPGRQGRNAAGRVLGVMGLSLDDPEPDFWLVTELLAHDESSRSSIAGAIRGARDNARAVRHVLPSELWERINATWVAMGVQQELTTRAGPSSYLSFVKHQTAAITGLADTTMSRDQTWLFFTLGRALERTDLTARQLGALPFEEITESGLVTLLRSCGGHEPYLRQAHGIVEIEGVIDFLLRDRLFPRSAFASLVLAEDCVAQLGSVGPSSWDEARGLLGLARAELEFAPPGGLLVDLPTRLADLQATCSVTCEAITRRYFIHTVPTEWRKGGPE